MAVRGVRWLPADGLFMVLVMIMCLFLGFAIESTGTQVLQEAGVALLIGCARDCQLTRSQAVVCSAKY